MVVYILFKLFLPVNSVRSETKGEASPWWISDKESAHPCKKHRFDP